MDILGADKNFVPTSFIKNYAIEAHLAYFITFGPTLAFLCHFRSPWANFITLLPEKKAQHCLAGCPMLCSNLVPPLPTKNRPSMPFQTFPNIVSLNRWSHMALIVNIPIFGPFLVLFGPWENPNMKNALC